MWVVTVVVSLMFRVTGEGGLRLHPPCPLIPKLSPKEQRFLGHAILGLRERARKLQETCNVT